jgi:hypothetical protein
MRPVVARCHLGLGRVAVASGRRAEARAELAAAVDLYRDMAIASGLGEAETALASAQ